MSDWLNRARTGPPYATGRFATREQLEDYVVAAWRAGNLQKDIAVDVGVSPPCVCEIRTTPAGGGANITGSQGAGSSSSYTCVT